MRNEPGEGFMPLSTTQQLERACYLIVVARNLLPVILIEQTPHGPVGMTVGPAIQAVEAISHSFGRKSIGR